MREVIKSVLEKAEELGVDVAQIIHKVILSFSATLIILLFPSRLTDHQASFGTLVWCLPTGSWLQSLGFQSLISLSNQCTTRYA